MHSKAEATYGRRVRVRVGALVVDDDANPPAILLVEHDGIHGDESGGTFWTPPGGGVEFGEALGKALVREVEEETSLAVEVGPLRYCLDFVRPPLHAVSFYFSARVTDGTLGSGHDPELEDQQLIRAVRFVPFEELSGLTLYPEGLADRLPRDAAAGFPGGTRYLGTLR